jgi:hypothetical protein
LISAWTMTQMLCGIEKSMWDEILRVMWGWAKDLWTVLGTFCESPGPSKTTRQGPVLTWKNERSVRRRDKQLYSRLTWLREAFQTALDSLCESPGHAKLIDEGLAHLNKEELAQRVTLCSTWDFSHAKSGTVPGTLPLLASNYSLVRVRVSV